jgi:hypothetical protein
MAALYVPLGRDLLERLDQVARAERRHPRDQAVGLLGQALRREGAPELPLPRQPMAPDGDGGRG